MNYWFGEEKSQEDWMKEKAWSEVRSKQRAFSKISLEEIIDVLDGFSSQWKPETETFIKAIQPLIEESDFSEEEVVSTLTILPTLLSRESLEARLRSEFGETAVLDRFAKIPHFQGYVKAVPNGSLLHVTAGNVFLSSIDSLIMGFLTKNISFLKVSSQNRFFPVYFAKMLSAFDHKKILSDKFAVLYWKGGEEEVENFIKNKVNAIVAWGGEEMINSYKKGLSSQVKLLDFGPKISFQLITKSGLAEKNIDVVAEKIVEDILPWDQGACASPQNLFLSSDIEEELLLQALEKAFNKAPPRGKLSEDEATEILKEKYRGYYSEIMQDGKILEGENFLVNLEQNKFLRPSPLHRSLIVKRFKDAKDLGDSLEPFSYYLQSCSYLLGKDEKQDYLNELSLVGIKRFAPLGTVTWGIDGAPHDGRFVLRELVQFIGDESRTIDYGEKHLSLQTSKDLKSKFDSSSHPHGYVFSSGGTTGEPKYVHFSYEEFDFMTDMLAQNLRAQGIRPGMTVANLFVAGNLWSSFLAVESALKKIGAVQLPIGGLCPVENIITYLHKFKPDVVMGIPSLLVMNAEASAEKKIDLKIKKVFYAGEALSQSRREYLKKMWQTEYFGSSGYASVDAGVIGYQCDHCGPGEHHLFSDHVSMKIIDGQGIVSSGVKHSLPIENYATGDRVEWIDDCSCGRKDKRFKLLGRIDNTIQIWSCRLLLSEIETGISEVDKNILTFQLKIAEEEKENTIKEQLHLLLEVEAKLKEEDLLRKIYDSSRDLKDTISFKDFVQNTKITFLNHGEIPRNPRTGKVSLIVDQRL